MKKFDDIGVQIPEIYLPENDIDLKKWAVIACDQFTSEPEYWHQVENIVGDSPSTFHMILPEVYLGKDDETKRIRYSNEKMSEYLKSGIFRPFEGFVLVERKVKGKTRYGLMMALDLEKYDYSKGSQSLIRATEGTILERIPPRVRIRENARLEFPHILVLIDDPEKTVIEPVIEKVDRLEKLYDFDLMQSSGHLRGFAVDNPQIQQNIIAALSDLANPEEFHQRYGVSEDKDVLLFAMGDGNHSLATAKAIWEKVKPHVKMDHPARYALVEIENVHSDGLEFRPIHRVIFNVRNDPVEAMKNHWGNNMIFEPVSSQKEMVEKVDLAPNGDQKFGFIQKNEFGVITIKNPDSNLSVGTLQNFLDEWLAAGGAEKIDYVHGEKSTCDLANKPGNCGFYLPAMPKSELFKTVIIDGALPRKTFSMGEAEEKRFYLEGRKISE